MHLISNTDFALFVIKMRGYCLRVWTAAWWEKWEVFSHLFCLITIQGFIETCPIATKAFQRLPFFPNKRDVVFLKNVAFSSLFLWFYGKFWLIRKINVQSWSREGKVRIQYAQIFVQAFIYLFLECTQHRLSAPPIRVFWFEYNNNNIPTVSIFLTFRLKSTWIKNWLNFLHTPFPLTLLVIALFGIEKRDEFNQVRNFHALFCWFFRFQQNIVLFISVVLINKSREHHYKLNLSQKQVLQMQIRLFLWAFGQQHLTFWTLLVFFVPANL